MKIKFNKVFGFLLVFSLLIAACGGNTENNANGNDSDGNNSSNSDSQNSNNGGDSGDDSSEGAVIALSSLDVNLDPATATDEDSLLVNSYLYSTLVGVEGGNVVAALAAVWEVSDDGLDYVFTLRGDASFSDGSPVTSDVVIANFERWFDPANELNGGNNYEAWVTYFFGYKGYNNDDGTPLSIFDGIEKVDNVTFLIHLNDQYPEFLEAIANVEFSILSPDAIASGDVLGTGAYTLTSKGDDKIELAPNASYWGTVPSDSVEFGTN